ncbi:MAG: DUF115 domain-containing protein [Candidatus Hydrothermarchaeota archaeon]|jgi:hypothetical protein|nr:DUF115 domain-containing protein [Candidatus Hydrothermarchaeota archaeon]MDP6612532.1 DUF115 domain-containing protein [Candidatus Hydrothermarchaeota archaeon]
MDYAEWRIFYEDILRDFGFSEENDIKAVRILNDLVKPLPLEVLEEKIADKRVCIYGSGQSLEKVEDFPRCAKIAADGATTYLLGKGIVPEVVVTDLDGMIEDLYKANGEGSIMVIHAHGDNLDKIKVYAREFTRVIPTCQCEPLGNLQNFGGFTDGDRAVFLAVHFKAREIVLYGMDFEGVGKYSFSKDTPIKRKKLKWGKRLIDYLRQKGDIKITEG